MMIKTTLVAGAAMAATWFGAAVFGAGESPGAAQAAAAPQTYCAGETPWCGCVEPVQSCMQSTVGWSVLNQFAW